MIEALISRVSLVLVTSNETLTQIPNFHKGKKKENNIKRQDTGSVACL